VSGLVLIAQAVRVLLECGQTDGQMHLNATPMPVAISAWVIISVIVTGYVKYQFKFENENGYSFSTAIAVLFEVLNMQTVSL